MDYNLHNHQKTTENRQITLNYWKMSLSVFKWIVGVIGITWTTKIIDAGFRDRTIGIQEMQQYDQYVKNVILNNDVGPKKLLAEYHMTLTPNEALRKRWEAYY